MLPVLHDQIVDGWIHSSQQIITKTDKVLDIENTRGEFSLWVQERKILQNIYNFDVFLDSLK